MKMTEDQIKAIAAKIADNSYRHMSDGNGVRLMAEEYESVIRQLLQDYCMVEREKVMEAHTKYKNQERKFKAISYRSDDFLCGSGYGGTEALDDLFGTSMFNQNEAQYTEQCKTCMRKLAGEVLEVCNDATDENRHCQWNGSKSQDHCLYKVFWDRYPESHWQTTLTPEQFNLAKSLNQNK